MNYLLLVLAALCIAAQFSFTKIYQLKYSKGIKSLFFFSAAVALTSCVLFWALNGFRVGFSTFSFIMAVLVAVVLTLNNIMSIVVVKYGEVSVYTVFMMLGGMILPFLYGVIFLNETPSVGSIVGIILLVVSLFLSVSDKLKSKADNAKLFALLCLAVFFLNGTVSILSKIHQISPKAIGTNDFLVWNYLASFVLSIILLAVSSAVTAKRNLPIMVHSGKKSVAIGVLTFIIIAVIGSLGYLCQLLGAKNLPASVLYPIVSGGSIVLTAAAGKIFFGEKMPPIKLLSLSLTLIGTVMFLC